MQSSFEESFLVEEVAPFILKSNFLSVEYCKYILACCKHANNWKSNKKDPYATQDIYFEQDFPAFFNSISKTLVNRLSPLISSRYGTEIEEAYSIFAIKYCQEGQTELKLHCDESYISGSIKLNNDYEGGELYFPEQDYSNRDTNIGDIILWPGNITHPHECKKVTKGEKYALVIWTKYPKLGC